MDNEQSAFQFYATNNIAVDNKSFDNKKKRNKSSSQKNQQPTKLRSNVAQNNVETGHKRKRSKKPRNKSTSSSVEEINDIGNDTGNEGTSTDDVQTSEKKKLVKSKRQKTVSFDSTQSVELLNGSKESFSTEIVSKKKKKSLNISNDSSEDEFTVLEFDLDESSVEQGKKMLRWIIAPIDNDKFFKHNWEQRPIHVIRHCKSYYKALLSCEKINAALRKDMFYFGKNIDITSYVDGKRQTHNPAGRANAPTVWDFYNNGCSIRILNPQTFFPRIHLLNSKLQEFFGCFVGANVYLTPPDTQGFAPHYDDIEAFVLQIEGKKKWKLYGPRTESEILPRESSKNFTEDELSPLIMEVELQAGDLLYFPRGFIHQACAVDGVHSLHITLSVYQKNSWADLLEKLIPAALSRAIDEDVSFRQGLPLNYLDYMGVVNSDVDTPQRMEFMNTLQTLICKLVQYAPVDAAVDQMGKQFMIDGLPPCLQNEEKSRTVFGDGEMIKNGVVKNVAEMQLDTRVRLLRYNALRLVTEEDKILVYYNINNSKEYHGEEPQCFEIEEDNAPAVEHLIRSYPEYVSVEDLPVEDEIQRIQIAATLWEVGLIITEEPLAYDSE